MKNKTKKLFGILALSACLACFGGGMLFASADEIENGAIGDGSETESVGGITEETPETPETPDNPEDSEEPDLSALTQTYTFGELPKLCWQNDFGLADKGYVELGIKAAPNLFGKDAENFGLVDFDTKDGENKVSCSEIGGLAAENWKWDFGGNTSVVAVFEMKITGTVKFDFIGLNLDGWLEANWNAVVSVYRESAAGEVTTVRRLFQGKEEISQTSYSGELKSHNELLTVSVDVTEGDTLYYEIGSLAADRNFQSLQDAGIIVTPSEPSEAVQAGLAAQLDLKVKNLVQANYAESDWTAIQEIVAGFKSGTYATLAQLSEAYDGAVRGINAIKPDALKDLRTTLLAQLAAYKNSLAQANFTASDWETLTTAYNGFVAGAADYETEDALREAYGTALAAMQAIKPYKQIQGFLQIPAAVQAANYGWVSGAVVDITLKHGSVKDGSILDFDGFSNSSLTSSANNAVVGGNWKWDWTVDDGVILGYKANANCKITAVCTRVADGEAHGWTEDSVMNFYIVRGEEVKKIETRNAPSTDAQFGYELFAKEGDIIYIEFISYTLNAGEQRNTQTPFATTATADSTLFDAEKYAEQNHDVSAEVTAAIAEKAEALRTYYAGLTEADYSASNWLLFEDYINSFNTRSETEVNTVEEVNALYEEILAEMKGVQSLSQAAAALQATLAGYAAELQAEYDKLVKENKYSKENKAVLDQALADGKAAIEGAKTASAGNTAKRNAIAALGAVEPSKGGGNGALIGGLVGGAVSVAAIAAVATVFIVKKKKSGKEKSVGEE